MVVNRKNRETIALNVELFSRKFKYFTIVSFVAKLSVYQTIKYIFIIAKIEPLLVYIYTSNIIKLKSIFNTQSRCNIHKGPGSQLNTWVQIQTNRNRSIRYFVFKSNYAVSTQ